MVDALTFGVVIGVVVLVLFISIAINVARRLYSNRCNRQNCLTSCRDFWCIWGECLMSIGRSCRQIRFSNPFSFRLNQRDINTERWEVSYNTSNVTTIGFRITPPPSYEEATREPPPYPGTTNEAYM